MDSAKVCDSDGRDKQKAGWTPPRYVTVMGEGRTQPRYVTVKGEGRTQPRYVMEDINRRSGGL